MPTSQQKGDKAQACRPAEVYLMRLPDSSAVKKKAPYIIHQVITGADKQASGELPQASAIIRTVFCVYAIDEQEGALALLGLMERLRIELLRQKVIGRQFELDLEAGLETLIYTDNTAPYFIGEMLSVWQIPAIEREVVYG